MRKAAISSLDLLCSPHVRVFQKESSEGLEVPQVQPCSDIYLLLGIGAAVQNPLTGASGPRDYVGVSAIVGNLA